MSIIDTQNAGSQIEMLAAQRQLYSSAKKIIGLQMMLAGPVAVTATLLGLFYTELRDYASLLGITILILDLVLLSPRQKRLRCQGALVQEAFDTKVLDIEWNDLKVGKRPEPDLIFEYAVALGKDSQKAEKLRNWYPVAVQQLPVHWGRIVCQRANIWWDSTLRRRYANTLLTCLIFLAISLVWFAFSQGLSFADFMIKMVLPMVALYKLGVTQFVEHRDAADRLDKLRDHAENLWADAIGGAKLEALKVKSRNLQDEIFDGRKKNPPIFDFIFWMFRDKNQLQMNRGVEVLIQAAKLATKPR